MEAQALRILGVVAMTAALFLTPLGLPGNWIMLGVVAVGAAAGEVGLGLAAALALVAGAAEVAEFLLVKRYSERYGGSRRAFWGAVAGGVAGVVIGVPVPVVGSLLAGVGGTFVGAFAVAWWEKRVLRNAGRVGWGALLGRVASAAVKTGAGVAILVVGGAALLV